MHPPTTNSPPQTQHEKPQQTALSMIPRGPILHKFKPPPARHTVPAKAASPKQASLSICDSPQLEIPSKLLNPPVLRKINGGYSLTGCMWTVQHIGGTWKESVLSMELLGLDSEARSRAKYVRPLVASRISWAKFKAAMCEQDREFADALGKGPITIDHVVVHDKEDFQRAVGELRVARSYWFWSPDRVVVIWVTTHCLVVTG